MIKRATQAQGLNPTTHPLSSDAIEGAVRWLLRLRSGLPDRARRAAFERWYARSAEHAQALEDALWIWSMLGSRVIREAVSSERNAAKPTGHGIDDG
jgi:ferric-dicitrate binding protein FerR (iron transport regulator)